jgi:helix-turn-helix protein
VAHANARLTPAGRRTLVRRIETDPRPIAHIAHEMGISRATASRWWTRYQQQGEAGLVDRSSIPYRFRPVRALLGECEDGRVGLRDPVVGREFEPVFVAGELVDAGVQGGQTGVS